MIAGTPMQMSDWPYSPSSRHEQGIIFFWSLRIASTIIAEAAPGAYHADVPMSLVSVAPPTIVLATASSSFFFDANCDTGTPFTVAFETSGIIVVSPWPPMTMPSTLLMLAPVTLAR